MIKIKKVKRELIFEGNTNYGDWETDPILQEVIECEGEIYLPLSFVLKIFSEEICMLEDIPRRVRVSDPK